MDAAFLKRAAEDIRGLQRAGFPVRLVDGDVRSFSSFIMGPKETPYEGGIWEVRVFLPNEYPFKSPSVGFAANSIIHPNVDTASGSICLDVLNARWTPLFNLVNTVGTFVPWLLAYPNPTDPLNGTAAAMLNKSPELYERTVREHVEKYMAERAPQLSEEEEAALRHVTAAVTAQTLATEQDKVIGAAYDGTEASAAPGADNARISAAAMGMGDAIRSPATGNMTLDLSDDLDGDFEF